mmetsp:Transcript_23414/g.66579  ORF Transcript_23414/g.66579 Transcript_23414/m.66579 type:complete len:215 (-) Transcript_23414:435-1079(-)
MRSSRSSLVTTALAAAPACTRCAPRPGFLRRDAMGRRLVSDASFFCMAAASAGSAAAVAPGALGPRRRPAMSLGSREGADGQVGADEDDDDDDDGSAAAGAAGPAAGSGTGGCSERVSGVGLRTGGSGLEAAEGGRGSGVELLERGGGGVFARLSGRLAAGVGVAPRDGGGVLSRMSSSSPLSPPSSDADSFFFFGSSLYWVSKVSRSVSATSL